MDKIKTLNNSINNLNKAEKRRKLKQADILLLKNVHKRAIMGKYIKD